MTPLSEEILRSYQMRKTKKQKTAFIQFMQSKFPEIRVEQGGFGNNRNLVIGDVASADVIYTAHYDTCAQMPFPNFICPKNFLLYLMYSLAICLPFAVIAIGLNMLLHCFTDSFLITYWGTFLPTMGLMFWLLMGGKANPNTANDNTSGVITLCRILEEMPAEDRSHTAFVFFDNEENGLLGSAYFQKIHKKDGINSKLVVNFDCVSDGDHLLFVLTKPVRKRYGDAFAAAFPAQNGKVVYFEKAATTIYPSDQAYFPLGVGVAALKKKRGVGLYMNRIHTVKDTVFQKEMIDFFVSGALRLTEQLRRSV